MVLAASAASASADTVQLSSSCQVTSTFQGSSCRTHQRCPDRVSTNSGKQDVLGCVASGEVIASGDLTGILRATVLARPRLGGVTPGPRVRAGCSGTFKACRARTDGQNIGNGGPTGADDVETAVCSTKRSLGVLSINTKCIVWVNALLAP